MKFRGFGRSGHEVSELVFGGGKVGGILIHQDEATKRAAIRRALDAGINWFDTAAKYGDGKSEDSLGWLLQEVPETPYLSTKVNIETARLDDIPDQIEESLHASLRRLRRESVDLLQFHNSIEPEIGPRAIDVAHVLGKGGVAEGLERMRAQGLTRLIGMTALGDAAASREVIESGRFDSAQVYYNLLNPSAGRAMPQRWRGHDFAGVIAACRARDMGVMAVRIFAAGVIATDERHGRESVLTRDSGIAEEERRARAVFEGFGPGHTTGHGTRAQTALRFVLANPDLSCAILGLAELSHLDEALAGAEMGSLSDGALARLDRLYAGDFGGP